MAIGGVLLAFALSRGRAKVLKLTQRISALFGTYVDGRVRDRIMNAQGTLAETKDVAVLFSDIRGFTAVTERSEASAVVEMLNLYFSEWDRVSQAHGGFIDKFIGDAVMVIFEPRPGGEPAQDAVRCAREMLGGLGALRSQLADQALPVLPAIGVGIACGPVILGNIGSASRRNYTAIGDTVNTASRLESACKQLNRTLIVSATVHELLDEELRDGFAYLGKATLKGKSDCIPIFGASIRLTTAHFPRGLAIGRFIAEAAMKDDSSDRHNVATFGGGCFWCIEAVLQRIEGVLSVTSGYAGGTTPNPTYEEVCSGETGHAEVVQVAFDPPLISYDEILDIFWQAHDPTTLNRQGADTGTQYRSIIFYADEAAARGGGKARRRRAQAKYQDPVVTEILPLETVLEGGGLPPELLQYPPGRGVLPDGHLPEAEEAEAGVSAASRCRRRGPPPSAPRGLLSGTVSRTCPGHSRCSPSGAPCSSGVSRSSARRRS